MTSTQLLLTIGIPSILIVLAWLSNNTRLSALENRFSGLENRLDGRMSSLAARQESMADTQHRDAVELLRAITALHERVAKVEARQP